MSSHTHRISTACIILLASITGACADANPTAPGVSEVRPAYSASIAAATAWTVSPEDNGATVVSDGTAGDAVMSYLFTGSTSNSFWFFTTTADQTGTVTLPWTLSGNHGASGNALVGATVNGEPVAFLLDTTTAGAFTFSGTYTFTVNAGDTYGFIVGGEPFADPLLSGTFAVDLTNDPATRNDCMHGGWATYGFQNQGQCIALVETGHDSR